MAKKKGFVPVAAFWRNTTPDGDGFEVMATVSPELLASATPEEISQRIHGSMVKAMRERVAKTNAEIDGLILNGTGKNKPRGILSVEQ